MAVRSSAPSRAEDDDPLSWESVLAVRAAGLGDLVVALPALQALRAGLPDVRLTLAAPTGLAPLVDGVADEVLDVRAQDSTEGLQALAASPRRFDAVVNLHGRGPQSHLACAPLARHRLVGFRCPPVAADGPRWRAEHEVDRWCRLVSHVLAVPVPPVLRVPLVDRPADRSVVVLHVGASRRDKTWPLERWAQVARSLHADGHPLVLTGGHDERPASHTVVRAAGLPRSADLAGRTGVAELITLVASARLVVCGDTGIGHLAWATGTPTVRVFGRAAPEWEPRDGPHTIVRGSGMAAIGVAEVLAAVGAALSSSSDLPRASAAG